MSDVCPCHGEPWYHDSSNFKTCAVKTRARKRRYARSEKGRATNRKAVARYQAKRYRVHVGSLEYSLPCTPEQREKILAFKSRQREETDGRQH